MRNDPLLLTLWACLCFCLGLWFPLVGPTILSNLLMPPAPPMIRHWPQFYSELSDTLLDKPISKNMRLTLVIIKFNACLFIVGWVLWMASIKRRWSLYGLTGHKHQVPMCSAALDYFFNISFRLSFPFIILVVGTIFFCCPLLMPDLIF